MHASCINIILLPLVSGSTDHYLLILITLAQAAQDCAGNAPPHTLWDSPYCHAIAAASGAILIPDNPIHPLIRFLESNHIWSEMPTSISIDEPLALWCHRFPIRFALAVVCSKLHEELQLAGSPIDPVHVNRIFNSTVSPDSARPIALNLRHFLASLIYLPSAWHPFLGTIIRWLVTIHTPEDVIHAASTNIDKLIWPYIELGHEREVLCDITSAISEVCLDNEKFVNFESLANLCFWTLRRIAHLCPLPTNDHSSPLDINYAFLPLVRVSLRVLQKLPLPDINTDFFDGLLDIYDDVCALDKLLGPAGFKTPIFVDGTLRDLRSCANTSKEFEFLLTYGEFVIAELACNPQFSYIFPFSRV